MDDEMKFLGLGAYLYGALAITGLFVAGLVEGNSLTYLAAIGAAAGAYIAQYGAAFRAAGHAWGGKAYGLGLAASLLCAVTSFISLLG